LATLAVDVKSKLNSLAGRRDPWLQVWQELCEVFLPTRANFTAPRREAERQNETVYDGTPRMAARELASALDGLIKPKTSNWFEPTFGDEEVAQRPAVRDWLVKVREKMWLAIYNKDARFIQRSSEVDESLVVMGWGTLWITENKNRNGLMFRSFHNKDVLIDENADGVIDTIGIIEELTARQAIQRFPAEKLHKDIIEAASSTDGTKQKKIFKFVQLVMPAGEYLSGRIGEKGMAFTSCALDWDHEEIVSQGGYFEFPAACPRWETEPGTVYPRSAAMLALPDALTLQAISKTLLVGGERAADPPLMVPSDAFISPVRTFPGGISVFDVQAMVDGGLSSPVFPLPTSTQLPVSRDMQNDYRIQVQNAFYKNVLNLPTEGFKTATEVLERKEEFIRVLGPIFGRLEADYLGNIAERVFAIMDRAGAFPDRPTDIQDMPIIFRFQSPLQQARKALDVAGFNRVLEVMTPLATVQPWIFDNIDGDKIVRDSPEWAGIPQKWLKDQEMVDEDREERNQAAEDAAMVEGAAPVADAMKSAAQAQNISAETNALTPTVPGV
jgi:hypothetical protein